MKELAKQFIGKECIIYTVTGTDSVIKGIVKEVTDGGIVVEKKRRHRGGQSGICHAYPRMAAQLKGQEKADFRVMKSAENPSFRVHSTRKERFFCIGISVI